MVEVIKFDFKTFNNVKDTSDYKNKIHDIRKKIDSKKDMLDWYDVDTCITENEVKRIKKVGKYIRNNADVLIVVGAGGAYLGSKAVIEMFKEYYTMLRGRLEYFAFDPFFIKDSDRETFNTLNEMNCFFGEDLNYQNQL